MSALVRELRDAVRDLPITGEGPWRGHETELKRLILDDDPEQFIHWAQVLRTMRYAPPCGVSEMEWVTLAGLGDFADRWLPALGDPTLDVVKAMPAGVMTDANTIHQAYHLAFFERMMSVPVYELGSIFEFGGGYGALCRVAHGLGFTGGYVLYDLPIASALQRFYLQSAGLTVVDAAEYRGTGITCVSAIDKLPPELCMNWPNLFIALWSLSETPPAVRDSVVGSFWGFKHYLMAYGETYDGIDNVAWFDEWRNGLHARRWVDWPVAAVSPGSHYLMGSAL